MSDGKSYNHRASALARAIEQRLRARSLQIYTLWSTSQDLMRHLWMGRDRYRNRWYAAPHALLLYCFITGMYSTFPQRARNLGHRRNNGEPLVDGQAIVHSLAHSSPLIESLTLVVRIINHQKSLNSPYRDRLGHPILVIVINTHYYLTRFNLLI